jgi:hypothetical protein
VSDWETVINTHKFVQATLRQLDAHLRGNYCLSGNWGLAGLLDRQARSGCAVQLETPKGVATATQQENKKGENHGINIQSNIK